MDHLWIHENSSFPASPIFVLHDHHRHYQGWLQPFDDLRYHPWMVYLDTYIGVSKNRGTLKWMVKIMEKPIKMGLFGGTPIFGNTHICLNMAIQLWSECGSSDTRINWFLHHAFLVGPKHQTNTWNTRTTFAQISPGGATNKQAGDDMVTDVNKKVIEVVQMMNKHISTMLEQYSIYTFGPQNPLKDAGFGPIMHGSNHPYKMKETWVPMVMFYYFIISIRCCRPRLKTVHVAECPKPSLTPASAPAAAPTATAPNTLEEVEDMAGGTNEWENQLEPKNTNMTTWFEFHESLYKIYKCLEHYDPCMPGSKVPHIGDGHHTMNTESFEWV